MLIRDIYNTLLDALHRGEVPSLTSNEARKWLLKKFPNATKSATLYFKSFKLKWEKASRKASRFEAREDGWLKKPFDTGKPPEPPTPSKSADSIVVDENDEPQASGDATGTKRPLGEDSSNVDAKRGPGRPKVDFSDLSSPTSRRSRAAELGESHSAQELLEMAAHLLRKQGRHKDAEVVKGIALSKEDGEFMESQSQNYSSDEALALILDARLSKEDYQTLRDGAVKRGSKLYPAYNHVREAKERCIPKDVKYSDYSAEIPLQSIVDHTVQRLMLTLEKPDCALGTTLVAKWKAGFDGSTGQSVYKQLPSEEAGEDLAGNQEQSLMYTAIVLLEISDEATGKVYYQNNKASSTHYCRPVSFRYIKEDEAVLQEEYDKFVKADLRVTSFGEEFCIKHDIQVTMVDGKVQNLLSKKVNSMQCCSMCGISPKGMNALKKVEKFKKKVDSESLDMGLSTLHMWIRFMECLLHISYMLQVKKWQARGVRDKVKKAARKKMIQKKLRAELGLIVDVPRSDGAGTSNDGNTARTFFRNHERVARILGLQKDLVKRFYIVLCTLASFEHIDSLAFTHYSSCTLHEPKAWIQESASQLY